MRAAWPLSQPYLLMAWRSQTVLQLGQEAGEADSLRRKPQTLSFAEAASVGVNFMAAWCGTDEALSQNIRCCD